MVSDDKPRASDYLWALVATVMSAVLLRQLVLSAAALVRDPTGEQLLSFVVVGALILVSGRWLVGGAWRRTVWGAPPGGVREHREHRARAAVSEHPAEEP